MWPFRKRNREPAENSPAPPSAEALLLRAFLENERVRIEKQAELEGQRHALEMERTKLELADIERIGEEKRKQQLFTERLKEQKRDSLAKAREIKRQKDAAAKAGPQAVIDFQCEECQALTENRQPRHSSHLMLHTMNNHTARFSHN